ncbi:hypothetical protein [Nonomuraea sp. NPDC049607]|uniref:hypothetical protein n=1 Tax=Nonomuraea sp. NPDC049607 TaxID=3154732 RepID=UPI00344A2E17
MSLTAASPSPRRSVTVLFAAAAAVGALIVASPSAQAQGNCYHYGYAGYAQLFTGYNFDGDCYEVQLNTGRHAIPAYAARKVSSVRSWGWYGTETVELSDSYYGGVARIAAGQWVTNLGNMDDKADGVEFR